MLSPVKVTKRAKEKLRAYRVQLKNERLRVREKRTSIQSETRRERERALLQIVAFRVSSLQAIRRKRVRKVKRSSLLFIFRGS